MVKKIEREDASPHEAHAIVDIKNGNFRFHWTKMKGLGRKLRTGIYSLEFARRIRDRDYTVRASSRFPQPPGPGGKTWEHFVFVTGNLHTAFTLRKSPRNHAREDPTALIGIVLTGLSQDEVPLRIAPRQFIGLVIVDRMPNYPDSRASWVQKLNDPEQREAHIEEMLAQIRGLYDSGMSPNSKLPVYGYSGRVYLPKRMSHEEVIEVASNSVQ